LYEINTLAVNSLTMNVYIQESIKRIPMKKIYMFSETGAGNRGAFRAGNNMPLFSLTILVLLTLLTTDLIAQVCCPKFILKDAVEICPPEGACQSSGTAGGRSSGFVGCKLSTHQYTVYPNDPGYSYTWSVTGGTPASFSGNPINILWGNGSNRIYKSGHQ